VPNSKSKQFTDSDASTGSESQGQGDLPVTAYQLNRLRLSPTLRVLLVSGDASPLLLRHALG